MQRQTTTDFTQPIISIHKLDHYFGRKSLKRQVLHDINLSIKSGEIVIMTGPSGSGKTTLLSLVGGLRACQRGSLQVIGQELYGAKPEQLIRTRKQIGYIFQANNLLESLTARQNVEMSLQLHDRLSWRSQKAKAQEILEAVGLGHKANDYPSNLSGGQKQRVAIARALVANPKIVLADEPTAALDKTAGRAVVELMQQLAKQQGSTILLVTHDNRILDIADRIIYMEDGCLISNQQRQQKILA